MNLDKLNQWLALVANLGVVFGTPGYMEFWQNRGMGLSAGFREELERVLALP